MNDGPYGTCKSCGASIIWVKMAKTGKSNPLDADPVPNGNVRIREDKLAEVVGGAAYIGVPLYISHFATCPGAASHRKAK